MIYKALLALLLLSPVAFYAQQSPAVSNLAARDIPLQTYGWTAPPPVIRTELRDCATGQLVVIDSSGRVLVGFTTRAQEGLSSRAEPPLLFHILRFGTDNRLDAELDVPTNNWCRNSIYVTASDRLLVRANDAIFVASLRAGQGASTISKLMPCDSNCVIRSTPTRQTLIVSEDSSNSPATVLTDDTTLRDVPCPNLPRGPFVLTDEYVYRDQDITHAGVIAGVYRSQLCAGPLERISGERGLLIGVLKDSSILLHRESMLLRVTPPDDHAAATAKLPKGEGFGIWISPDTLGSRFLILATRFSRTFLDTSGAGLSQSLLLYDSQSLNVVASIPLERGVFINRSQFTLSPDGHKIALLVHGVLHVANVRDGD
jgi:hypothetical protein